MNASVHAPSLRYLLFPLLAVFIWAVNMSVTKRAADVISPGSMSFYRWVLAGALLLPFSARGLWRERAAIRACWLKLAVLGLLGMVMYQGLSYFAAASTSATNMGIISSLIPVFTIGVSAVVAHERPRLAAVTGGLLSLAGLCVLLSQGDLARLVHTGVGIGDALMVLASLAYALYGVLLRKWALKLGAWQSLSMQIVFGVLFQLPGFLLSTPSPITADNLPLIVYAGIFPSLIGPFAWMEGVRHLGATRASAFLNLMPVLTAVIAALVLGEHLYGYHFLGGGIALAGVALSQWPARRTTPPAARGG